ncbi:hypothetical protein DsansV1_C14g0129021 [Dioscorea sansibarensis]
MARLLLPIMLVLFAVAVSMSRSIPFIVLHGIGDQCKDRELKQFTALLSHWSGSPGYCMVWMRVASFNSCCFQGNLIVHGIIMC